jgi:hypothetical protein
MTGRVIGSSGSSAAPAPGTAATTGGSRAAGSTGSSGEGSVSGGSCISGGGSAAGRGLDAATATAAATTGLRQFVRVGARPGRLFARLFLARFSGLLARVVALGLGVSGFLLTRSFVPPAGLLFGPFTARSPAAAIADTRARRAIARSLATRAGGFVAITGAVLVAQALRLANGITVALPGIGTGDGTATANEQPGCNETGKGGDTDAGSHLSAPLTASPRRHCSMFRRLSHNTASTVC